MSISINTDLFLCLFSIVEESKLINFIEDPYFLVI